MNVGQSQQDTPISPDAPTSPEAPSAKSQSKSHSLLFQGIIWLHVALALKRPQWQAGLLQAFRASLGGSLPAPGSGSLLLAACNDLYFDRFAKTLLYSLELQARQALAQTPSAQAQPASLQRVHLHLYLPSQATLACIGQLQQSCNHIAITYTVDPCDLARDLPDPVMYFAAGRFLLASLLLEETGSPILCIDVDAMAIRPLAAAYEPLRTQGDIGLIFRPKAKLPWRRILASAVGFNPTAAGKRYSSAMARAMASLMRYKPTYHLDQIVLHYGARATQRSASVSFFDMPLSFSDYTFDPASVIWTAKGGRKHADAFQQRKQDIDAAFDSPHQS